MNSDIHPWDVLINGTRWDGKIRLVGFVDVFFLLCYSGQSRFEKGIIIYKDDMVIRDLIRETAVEGSSPQLEVVNKAEVEAAKNNNRENSVLERYFSFQKIKGGLDYTVTSLGHEVGVKTRYSKTDVRKYEIKIRKGRDATMKRRIRRGISQHGVFDLMHDALRLGIISQAEIIGFAVGKAIGGSTMEDVSAKYLSALTGARSSKNLAMEADRA